MQQFEEKTTVAKNQGFDPTLSDEESTSSWDLDASSEDAVLDLTQIDETINYPLIPPGIHDSYVDNCEYGVSRAHNPMWTWEFIVTLDDGKKAKAFYHTTLTAEGLGRVKRGIMAVAPEYDLATIKPQQSCFDMIGKPCRIRTKVRMFDGKMRSEVTDVLPTAETESFLSYPKR